MKAYSIAGALLLLALAIGQDNGAPADTVRLVAQTSPIGDFTAAAWSPDGSWILTADQGGAAKVWDSQSGFLIISIHVDSSKILSASFSPDGRKLMTSGLESPGTVWDLLTGKEILRIPGTKGCYSRFDGDANAAETELGKQDPVFWDIGSNKAKLRPKLHKNMGPKGFIPRASDPSPVGKMSGFIDPAKPAVVRGGLIVAVGSPGDTCLAVSADDAFSAHGSTSGAIKILSSGSLVKVLHGPLGSTSLCFSPDDKLIAEGTPDGGDVWDIDAGKIVGVITAPIIRGGYSVSFSPDGNSVLLWGGNRAEIWHATGSTRIVRLEGDTMATWLWSVEPGKSLSVISAARNRFRWTLSGLKRTTDPVDHLLLHYSSSVVAERRRSILRRYPSRVMEASGASSLSLCDDHGRVLAGYHDGHAVIYEGPTGKVLCCIYAFSDGGIAVTDPVGRYDAGDEGHVGGLHWIRNGTSPMGLDQLRFAYYTPSLLTKILRGEKLPEIPK